MGIIPKTFQALDAQRFLRFDGSGGLTAANIARATSSGVASTCLIFRLMGRPRERLFGFVIGSDLYCQIPNLVS